MTEREFSKILAKIENHFGNDGEEFSKIVEKMCDMLNDADQEDFYGTWGWRTEFGWE